MKTVYVNSNIIEILNESVLKDSLPTFIVSDVENNKTTFGNNPSLPGSSFLLNLYNNRFNYVLSSLKNLKKIDDVESSDTNHALGEIIQKCKEEEAPYRDKLEALCAKIVIDLFNIPDDSVGLIIKLVDEVNIDVNVVQFDKVSDKSDYSRELNFKNFNMEVEKRQVISSLNIGYGMLYSFNLKSYISDIYEINPKLVDLYHKFIILSEYSLFTNSHEKMTEKHNLQIGSVQLNISQIDEIPVINSCGVVFPVLLCETIRGFMELFSSHALPSDKKNASEILKRTDYLLSEPWYMRTGLSLWEIILEQIDDFDESLLPYLYRRICTLNINDFTRFMQSILTKSKNGKYMLSILLDKAENDFNDCRQDKMDKPDTDNGIITDNYIRDEEL